MVTFFIVLLLVTPDSATPVCVMQAEKMENFKTCEERAEKFNDEAPIHVTADGRLLVMRAICKTDV